MARRSNFIEGNDNFRDQNLRFVRNEFEDNINQFFGGANPEDNGPQQKPPPRDSLIVQPTAGSSELDNRRQFLRDLGASRVLANALAQRTFNVPKFNLRQFQRQRFRLSVELGDSHQDVVDKEVLRAIEDAVDGHDEVESRPRTPSPPRNIDWHFAKRDNSPVRNDRSRPRNRQREENFPDRRDNKRGIVEQREPINRNAGPVNAPINRNRNINRNNLAENPTVEFSRNNRGAIQQDPNRGNRNANAQDINRNSRNMDRTEFNRNNRNANDLEPNPDNRNAIFNRNESSRPNPQEFRGPNRNANPQEFNRNTNAQEFKRSNRNQNPQDFNRPIRNQNPQEFNRNNRNANPQEFNRNIRNANEQKFNHNRYASNDEFNRNNRNRNNDEFNRNNRNANNNAFPQGPNRNNRLANAQFIRNTFEEEPSFNNQHVQGPNHNTNYRGQVPNRVHPSNYDHSQVNNNRRPGNQKFVPIQQSNLDRNAMIDDDIQLPTDRFRSPEAHPKHGPYIDQDPRTNRGPQTGRNYQRIVNDNQIILCRTDWTNSNEGSPDHYGQNEYVPDERELLEDAHFMDDTDEAIMNDDHSGEEYETFSSPEEREFNRRSRGNQPNHRDHNIDDRNAYGRNRNDRNFEGIRRQFDRELDRRNLNDDFNQRNNSSRGGDIQRFPRREDDTFLDSNNPDFPPNYQQTIRRGSGSGNRYHDSSSNRPMGPNQTRVGHSGGPIQYGTNLNPNRSSLDRKMTKNINPGRKPQSRSSSYISTGAPNQPRSNSITSQTRGGSNPNRLASQYRSATSRNVKSGAPNLGSASPSLSRYENPGIPNQNIKKSAVPPNKPMITNPGASKLGQPVIKPKPQATKNNAAMAKPRAGQKRKAEATKLGANKAEPKRQRAETDRSFIIGGISLPYINSNIKQLPQPEAESYAVTFFEQTPIYNTNIYANDDGDVDEDEDMDEEDMSDAESLDSDRSGVQSKVKGRNSKKKMSAQLRKEWTKIYRTNNYKDWHAWWRDYKWCGSEINKKLDKYGDRNLRHRFAPIGPKGLTEQAINQIFKAGYMGLEKNTFSHYRNMRSIFLLMNETFLQSLSDEQMEKLQDLIRGIPNHLWLYKIRSMVYLWERYHGTLKTQGPKNIKSTKEIQTIARKWKNPVFHWLAKQAFDELKAISEIAWPDHNKIYPGLKS
ncbi:homeobox protein 2 isoform X1 [Drosophila erecta]|uniref:homeobox protein 2 isoform X1 n=1 Tax=Drosophila erecta TaxID=7220 RepID=UPI000F04CD36|nr:homeobox protein 2 isoform X1 [Drosophila erecta]XP_026834861.1 homeobox protein 2 isoform X1 [Drosophila erecta]XP_026834862.1 homeobox protein 2 isoform X1 [Drosophila erecta]